MKRFVSWVALLLAGLITASLSSCTSEPTPTLPFILNPPPSATPIPKSDTGTPSPPTESSGYPVPRTPLNANDLDYLPDDPTELMYATFDHSLALVGRKMAYSHNPAFIPVILEFLRFQPDEESQLTLASFMVRIRDEIPEDDFSIVPFEQDNWGWWVEWLAEHPEVKAPDGFDGWKGQLFNIIDEPMGAFMYPGVPTTIRLEEIVWGGVKRDGIPDLRFPPHVAPEEATYLETGDRVFGVSINGEHRAYPLRVLNPHEMANDIVGDVQFALAY